MSITTSLDRVSSPTPSPAINQEGLIKSHTPRGPGLAIIEGVEIHVPSRRVEVADLVAAGTVDSALADSWGVVSVPVAEAGCHASDLMVRAGKALLERLGMQPADISVVVTASTLPHEFAMRTLAPYVARQLGLENIQAFDMYQGCNVFTAQLDHAIDHVAMYPDRGKVLILCGDRWDHYSTQHTAAGLIFGDSGAAAVIGTERRVGAIERVSSRSWADGSLYGMAGYPSGSRAWDEPRSALNTVYQVLDPGMLRGKFLSVNFDAFERVADAALADAGVSREQVAAVAVPSGRAGVMRKLISHLGLEHATNNVGFLRRSGDLSGVSPYRDLRLLAPAVPSDGKQVLLLLTQGGGMVWTASVFRNIGPQRERS